MKSNSLIVPAREGRSFKVVNGQQFKVITPHGAQAADFFAFNAENVEEWLSANITWTWTRHVRPRPGDTFLSRFRRPMVHFIEDGANGVHDMMIAACDQFRYEQLGYEGNHPNCADNLANAMRRSGYEINVIPQPVNLFTNTCVTEEGNFEGRAEPQAPAGGYVTFEAKMDLICAVSACPYDLALADWQINGGRQSTTDIVIEFI